MKKIIVAFAIAISAFVVQAASFNWQLAKDDAKTYGGSTVYVIDGANASAVTALLAAGGADLASSFNAYVIGQATANSRGAAAGAIDNFSGTSVAYVVFSGNSIAEGSTYDMTAVIDVTGNLYTPPASNPGDLAMTVDTFTSKGNTIGGATPGPEGVPEPTSGLLLLVGGAMLALRRKQK